MVRHEDQELDRSERARAAIDLEVSQVVELPRPRAPHTEEAARMYAVVTVTVRRPGAAHAAHAAYVPARRDPVSGPRLAEVLLIDHSSSMVIPPSRLAAARAAAVSALARIPDGAFFALVAGADRATMIYPRRPGLAVASAESRAAAEAALRECTPGGGTAMGTWLERAARLFRELPAAASPASPAYVRHALLLTDGRNEPGYETVDELRGRVERCAGAFDCDVVGIGDAWETDELLLITGALSGRTRAVADLTRLPDELAALAGRAAERDVTGLRLRLTHRAGAHPHLFEQVHPTRAALTPAHIDLAGVGAGAGGPVHEYELPPCGTETRAYLIGVGAPYDPAQLGKELLLTEVEVTADRPENLELPPPVQVLTRWTDDADLYSRLDPQVSHYQHMEELHGTFEEACRALKRDDRAAAEELLGTAWRLADAVGDAAMRDHLRRLVRVRDASRGEVELLDHIAKFDVEAARIQSSTTVLPDARIAHTRRPGGTR
ncbi:VWA domain-containing protein [Streptomyces kanamyceticus]|uniref:VWA domain-containing protein n=1 Tax=Streptomyces kanamyceticus TaxID=1967 RepID=A0A5J6GDZ9_STRKN|nr:vWA domain-containing protein [Streptomyces kanamyceticus]QEU93719.1 VWA domain-containing protein [Streptomyces kanamyceticus]